MKISILTFHRSFNYGAVLQAYALAEYLRRAGHQASVVDYQPPYRKKNGNAWSGKRMGIVANNLVTPLLWLRHRQFRQKHMGLAEGIYASLEELRTHAPQADVYMTGSDQVWNPRHLSEGFDPAFFLQFGPDIVKRVAYAPSFGADAVEERYRERLKELVSNYDALSMREEASAHFLSELVDRPVEHVLDPTLLLGDFDSICDSASAPRKGSYVFAYRLQDCPLFNETAASVAQQAGLPLVMTTGALRHLRESGKPRHPGVEQWLGLLRNAAYVVTNSFHGMVFATLFHRPFVPVVLTGTLRARNNRINGLLELLQFRDALVAENSLGPSLTAAESADWPSIDRYIAQARARSAHFIDNSLR
ncbi:MAG: polysaccharide pyruvyl transferase family protein [Opitutales bacterium]|nr:polysaccharide pyruvyl transferase family protein [Opitutales bacterium]